MHDLQPLLAAFVPIWALTAVGYLVSRTGLLGEQAELVLSRFVFHVAMPAALFTMLAKAPLTTFANTSMLAFAAGTLAATLLGWAGARWLFGRGPADRAISGMAAGYVNSANLGIPVAVQVLGDASFVGPVLLFQVLLVTPVILGLLDAGTAGGGTADAGTADAGTADAGTAGGGTPGAAARPHSARRARLRRLLRLPLRNPIILASALGALCSAIGWHPPAALGQSCQLLGNAGVPTALITLGMSLHARPAAERGSLRAEVGLTVLTKNLLQPLIAFAVGSLLLHLTAHQLLAVVICSALPTAQNVFVYAREYGASTALPRDSVLWSTLLSMVTLSAIDWTLAPTVH
ncbi:AEC family transporter [Kitasatospora sp. NBC_01287]|uniref:AEC family transporter n=1 Tax=Kitasatospora sp. NBC_01287 TaxID=2903573 RepID=UPI00224E06EC|nr:AEC family transporter [Kitasatospora sp. NBC_01287]MCX4745230.1 AEC family transporter [Kitasatospora sp. NBC_01287]